MDYKEAYSLLIADLIKKGNLKSDNVISAFFNISRAEYLTDDLKKLSTLDEPIPLGHGQTMSAPHMVAMMLELLDIRQGQNILEIGTGSGWNAALLAELVGPEGNIVTIETVEELHNLSKINLDEFFNVECVLGDGKKGYKEQSPYDRIIVTCAADEIPKDLVNQLKDGGIIVIPLGSQLMQELTKGTKKGKLIEKENHGACRFVPFV